MFDAHKKCYKNNHYGCSYATAIVVSTYYQYHYQYYQYYYYYY